MGGVSRGKISGKTRLLALIGHPVTHSLSPAMHNASFAEEGLDFVYVCLDVAPDELPAAVLGLEALKFRGFNVTMPHKRAMIPLVDELDEGARISGAVNTVVIEASKTRGYNTDGGGMVMACAEAGIGLSGKERPAPRLRRYGRSHRGRLLRGRNRRTPHRQQEHRTRHAPAGQAEPDRHEKTLGPPPRSAGTRLPDADVVVNATPLGMKADDPMPLPPEYVRKGEHSATWSTDPARRRHSSGWRASEAPASSPAAGCCSTRVCWPRSSGRAAIQT